MSIDPFRGVVGHRRVREMLRAELVAPVQAYLFVGPAKVGKGTVALRFASALLCGDDERCFGRAVARGHPDLVLVEPVGRAAITVDQTRAVVSRATLAPLEARRKVFLLEEAGAMNDEAANALLKTLEEPSPSTVFVLVATSVEELPATIASRCRTIVFGRVSDEDILRGLQDLGVAEEQARRVARISGGRPGLAVGLATREEVAAFRSLWLGIPLRMPEHPGDAYRLADEVIAAAEPLLAGIAARQETELAALEDPPKALRERQARELRRAADALHVTGLEILASFYRDAVAAQFGVPVRNADVPSAALTRLPPGRALWGAERILEAIDALGRHQRTRLVLAALFADLGADD